MTDAASVATRIRRAYEDFLSGGNPPADTVRSIVRDSWARSLTRGVDPSETSPDPLVGIGGAEQPGQEQWRVTVWASSSRLNLLVRA